MIWVDKMANLKSHRITIRVDSELNIKLNDLATKADITISELIRNYAINQKQDIVNKKDIMQWLYHLNKIGNNINQIAHRLNSDNIANKISDISYKSTFGKLISIENQLSNLTTLLNCSRK
jgi:predicted transcriptional regulator